MNAYWYGRLSTKKQEDGGGEERQAALAREWCERRGIPLDESASYFDSGTSSFHSQHLKRKNGGLRLFLVACEDGRVRAGSYLLVESLDRLSRDQLQEGQALIKRLLFDYQIRLIVLFTNTEYNATNYQQTHWSIDAEFDRAHSESFHKSERSKANWETKRSGLAKGGRITTKVPTWLKVEQGEPVEDRQKSPTVRRIFAMAAKGHGFAAIAMTLHREQVGTFGRGKFWRDSVVEKILKSRSVLGEYQPMRLAEVGEGKNKKMARVPAGPVVASYYPAIITVEQWLAAQQAIAGRKLPRGRAGGQRVANLFTGIVYDEAGDVMAHTSKAGYGYLQSGKKDTAGIRYSFFERSLLHFLREVKLTLSNQADVTELRVQADKLSQAIRNMKIKMTMAPEVFGDLADIYEQHKRDHAALVKEIESATVPLQAQFLQAKRLAEALATAKGEQLENLRLELRLAIRGTVSRIDVEVKGAKRKGKRIDATVTFRDGTKRTIYYLTRAGRLVEGGLILRGDMGDFASMYVMMAGAKEGGFPVDKEPSEQVRAKCKAMRIAKKSYKEIEAATGLHRTTIYRYLTDYDRTDDQTGRAKRTSSGPKATRRRGR